MKQQQKQRGEVVEGADVFVSPAGTKKILEIAGRMENVCMYLMFAKIMEFSFAHFALFGRSVRSK